LDNTTHDTFDDDDKFIDFSLFTFAFQASFALFSLMP